MKKEGSFKSIVFVMMLAMAIALFWEQLPIISNTIHYLLDPSAGKLINANLFWGMSIIVLVITLFSTLVQKYATDQVALKEIRKEQKELQKNMKEYKDHPEKMMEFQKEMLPLSGKMMKISMRGMVYTTIPFILFFRWFDDYFAVLGDPDIFWGFGWFGSYFILTLALSMILRKVLKVV